MKAGIRFGTMGMLATGLLVGQMAFAEGQGKCEGAGKQVQKDGECVSPGEGAGEKNQERKQAREQHREQMKERMQKHHEARKQLMDAVSAEEDAQKALAMVREHCVKQHEERSAFHAGEMEKRLAMLGERLKNSDMEEAKREEILKNMVKNMEERKAKAEEYYAALLADLDALKGKEDLTKKDILEVLRDARPEGIHNRDGKHGKERGEEMKRKRDGKGEGDGSGEMKRTREKKSSETNAPDA